MTATLPLIERLRKQFSRSSSYIAGTIYELVNPDGPEAADRIQKLEALLKELKRVFEHDSANLRTQAQSAFSDLQRRAIDARAYACEQAVVKIDETLKEYSCR